jgi:superfamily II DNA helicase RecQ
VCDPGAAVLRLFRHATQAERDMVQGIIEELRGVDSKATGTLHRNLGLVGTLSRDDFYALLDAMVRSRLIEIEEAVFEKDGEVIKFRKVRITETGLHLRGSTPLELLISDGMVEEFGGRTATPGRKKKTKSAAGKAAASVGATPARAIGIKTKEAVPVQLSAAGEALASRLKEWRAAEAKRLRIPAYIVMHDRSLTAVAHARPQTPRQLLEIDGIGPAKVEKFGEAILGLCGEAN